MTKQEFITLADNFTGKTRVMAHNIYCTKCNYMQDIIYPMSILSEMVKTVAELQSRTKGSFDLSGCVLYCDQKPGTLAIAAAIWANIKAIYYCKENNNFSETDERLYKYFKTLNPSELFDIKQIEHDECYEVFKEYMKADKQRY